MNFIIINQSHAQLIEKIALALHLEWAELPPWSDINQIEARLYLRCANQTESILCAYIDDNGNLLATASTIYQELPEITQATWWLGEVLTVPSARGKKIGVQLIERLYQEYRLNTDENLYLYTPDMQALYRRMGWQDVEECYVNGEFVTVMQR